MAKKNDTVTVLNSETDPAVLRSAQEMSELNEEEGGELYRAIDEARSTQGAEVILTRTMPADKAGFCDKIPVGEFELSQVKAKYGPGTYRVRFNGPKGFLPGGGTIKIAPAPESAVKNGGSDIATFLEIMEQRDRQKTEKMSRLTELGIPALTTIVAALISRNTSPDMTGLIAALKGPSVTELIAAMQSLNGGNTNKVDPIDQLIRVADVVQKFNPGGNAESKEGGSNWVDVLRDLVKEVVPAGREILSNLSEQQKIRANQPPLHIQPLPHLPPRVAAPNPNASREVPIVGVQTTDTSPQPSAESAISQERAMPGDNDMIELFLPMILQQLVKVTRWAINDFNPAAYAEVFMNELPQIVANYVNPHQALEYLNRADWFEKVTEFHAMLKPYREWCDEFREELITLVTEQLDEPEKEIPRPAEFGHKFTPKEKTVTPQIVDEFKDTGE